MKTTQWITLAVFIVCVFVPLGAVAEIRLPESRYVIGPGDVLEISVWKDQELTRSVKVLPDGHIAFPLIGQIQAAGKSLDQLTAELKQKLERFVPDVTLSILIAQVGSMYVYVIGRVNRPGHFALTSEINVLQALSMAGGLNPFAKKGDIKIFRETQGTTKVYPFDYEDVTKGVDLTTNIRLERGDVIVVP